MPEMVVTPWEVRGRIDYDKLIKEFGTRRIDAVLKERIKRAAGELHMFLRRDFVFSHRDLDLALKDYESKKGFFLYTGRGPSAGMHIGHLVPLMFTKWLQEKFDVNLYIEITDDEKFLFKEKSYEEIQGYADENTAHIAAVGFDPDKTFIFKDTEYIKEMYPLALKTAKKVLFSNTRAVFGFNEQTNIGMVFFPALQIVPTFFEKKRCLIPCAIDQDPYWRIQRDIAEKLGYYKTAAIHTKLIPPLSGTEGKMSASEELTAVYLNDRPEQVKNKIMKYAFSGGAETVEEHRRQGGNPDIDVSFQWLQILFEPDDKKIKRIRDDYGSGALLTGELKQILIDKINSFLSEHAKARKKAKVNKFKYDGKLARQMWK